MAHNVTEKDKMLSGRGIRPWHYSETKDRTTVVEGLVNASDILVKSGLDWRGDKRPVYFRNSKGEYVKIDEFVATIAALADGQEDYIGTASPDTPLFQPSDLVDFAQAALDVGLQAETAGSLRAKKLIWVQWAIPEGITIGGMETERMQLYLLTTTGMDPRGFPNAFQAKPTAVRVVCNNTWTAAMSGGAFSIPHSGDIQSKVGALRDYYKVTYKTYGQTVQELAEALANATYGKDDIKQFAHDLFPVRAASNKKVREEQEAWAAKRRVDYLSYLSNTANLNPIRDTYYGLVQGATGFDTWGRGYGSQSRRFEHLNGLDGQENLGQRATKLAIKQAGITLSASVQEQVDNILAGVDL